MKMFTKHKASWLVTALTTLSGIIALYFVGGDTQIPIHWNAAGEVDGYMAAFPGLFVAIGAQLFIILLFANLHLLEPRKEHLEKSQDIIEIICFGTCILFAGIQGLVIAASLGYASNVSIIFLLTGALFAIIGNYMGKLKSTFTVGIRTPWTLSSEDVWRKTHRLGGKLLMAAGVIIAVGSFVVAPESQVILMTATILPATLIPIVYSWMLWRKEQTN